MSEHPLDGLLRELVVVLSALTASETMWVREMGRLRLRRQSDARPLREAPADSSSAALHALERALQELGGTPSSSATSPELQALERALQELGGTPSSSTTRVNEAAPTTSAVPASPTFWPVAAEETGAVRATVKRSYNYFAELDEKLARLPEQRLRSGGN